MTLHVLSLLLNVILGTGRSTIHSGSQRGGFWRRRGDFLHWVLRFRSAEQSRAQQVRRAGLDYPHHGHLGHPIWGSGLRGRRDKPQHCSSSAWRCRGWLSSGHYLFPDLVVSGVSWPSPRLVPNCAPGLDRDRLADLGFCSRHGGCRRPAWLAMDVLDRGGTGAVAVLYYLTDRPGFRKSPSGVRPVPGGGTGDRHGRVAGTNYHHQGADAREGSSALPHP
jgi:hypothetical protein